MTPLATLMSWVTEDLPGVPHLVALRALNWAARDFCSYTRIWRAPTGDVAVSPSALKVTLPTPADTEIVQVHALWFNKRQVGVSDIVAVEQARQASGTAREPVVFGLASPTEVTFAPTPDTAGTLVAVVSLMPQRESSADSSLPDHLVTRYGEALADAAKMKLCQQQKRAWSDPAAAAQYMAAYQRVSGTARRDADSTYGAADVQVRLRTWV